MRFTLQHFFVWFACCLSLVAINLLVGGRAMLSQGIWTLIVCGSGALWSVLRYRKKNPTALFTPIKAMLIGIAGFVVLSLVVGYFAGVNTQEICTRTFESRYMRNLGVIQIQTVVENEESKIIRQELHFHPTEQNWVMVSQTMFGGIGDWMPMFRYPILYLQVDDLRALSKLKPVEKCHSIFMLDNPLDCKLAKLREMIFRELPTRDGLLDNSILEVWWTECEPLMRPLRSDDDLKKAITDYRSVHSARYSGYNVELSPFAVSVGLPP